MRNRNESIDQLCKAFGIHEPAESIELLCDEEFHHPVGTVSIEPFSGAEATLPAVDVEQCDFSELTSTISIDRSFTSDYYQPAKSVLINPTELNSMEEDLLLALLDQEKDISQFNVNDAYPLTRENLAHFQISLTHSLCKYTNLDRDDVYLVENCDVIPASELPNDLQFSGLNLRKIVGFISVKDNCLRFIPRENMYKLTDVLDFSKINNETRLGYAKFLCNLTDNENYLYFPKGRYERRFSLPSGHLFCDVTLLQPVVCSKNKEGDLSFSAVKEKNKAEGSFWNVYSEIHRLKVRSFGQVELHPPKNVVKRSKPSIPEQMLNPFLLFQCYEFAKRSPLLHPKPTILVNVSGKTIAIKMEREMPGVELKSIINSEFNNILKSRPLQYSTRERMLIVRELLCALQEQLGDRNVVHRDLKPENIMFDANTRTVSIVDYDFCKEKGATSNYERKYTLAFAPIEALAGLDRGVGTDVFSMGLTIAEFLGMHRDRSLKYSFKDFISVQEALEYFSNNTEIKEFPHIFSFDDEPAASAPQGNQRLLQPQRESMEALLRSMTVRDQQARCSAENALEQFESIYIAYELSYLSKKQHRNVKQAHAAACELRKQLYLYMQANKSRELTPSNAQVLMNMILDVVNELKDNLSEKALEVFIDTLRVKAFFGLQTVADLENTIFGIFNAFNTEKSELSALAQFADRYSTSNVNPLPQLAHRISANCKYLQKKAVKALLSVDGLLAFTAKSQERRSLYVTPIVNQMGKLGAVYISPSIQEVQLGVPLDDDNLDTGQDKKKRCRGV